MLTRIGPVQQKIILLLFGGIALGLSYSPTQYYRTLRLMRRDWNRINQQSFNRSIRSLCQEKLLREIRRPDGTVFLELTPPGRKQARYLSIFGNSMKIKPPKKWDKLWRVVIFDIPEKKRQFRDILRDHLKMIGFKELQQSVFIFPYPCEKEISCLTDLYSATRYVRILTVKTIDNEKALKERFFKRKKT